MPAAELVHMATINAQVGPMIEIGKGHKGTRVTANVSSLTVTSDRLNATLATDDAADWLTVGDDGTGLLDVRFTLETDDEALRLVGARAPWVAARVAAARFLNPMDPGLPVPEQEVFSGLIPAYVNDLVTARGTVRLTTWRLQFEPKPGADAALWDGPPIDLPIHRSIYLSI